MTTPATPLDGNTPNPAVPPSQVPASSPGVAQPAQPVTGNEGDNREPFIPRERFDQVNESKRQLEERLAALEQEREYYRNLATSQPGHQAAPGEGAAVQPANVDGLPEDYSNWDDWYAVEPAAATRWQARQAYREEREKDQYTQGKNAFMEKVFAQYPDIRDPVKRAQNPVYQEFANKLRENPHAATTIKGVQQLWELSELRVRSLQGPEAIERARQAGAQAEQQRQAAASHAGAPIGTPTPPAAPGGYGTPTLTAEQAKQAQRYGMTPEEYLKYYQAPKNTVTAVYEAAKRG